MTSPTPDHLWLHDNARDDGNEDVTGLHPRLAYRVRLFIEKCWEVNGERSAMIESGVRSREHQTLLYTLWRQGKYSAPVVADPNRYVGTIAGTDIQITGSYHMPATDGCGHAVDIVPRLGSSYAKMQFVEGLGEGFGLKRYVPTEPWHYQALGKWDGWLPGPEPPIGDIMVIGLYIDTDQNPKKYKLVVPEVGVTDWLADQGGSLAGWEARVQEANRTGVLAGPWVSDLFAKLK